jgi:hypothetical protein
VLPTSCCDANLVLKISSFMLMLLCCQPSAEDFQFRADVVLLPASFVLKISSLVLMLMMLQPLCCDVAFIDDDCISVYTNPC